ncbi:hypothetical protein FCL47_12280 [Desulfopila sp. IMCC35006]|uniref:hypothetical protein n=1 Tax=Desulfopila sp. IMCC35006 TaxID=2569542 RepID=UPI0010ABEFA0|nr:hypothetical protein [Desulfopila sp. IMCC35006]TKB25867.1 hypothetical protein FCL47_12280 [Desulfopila sp. IMCC35006]
MGLFKSVISDARPSKAAESSQQGASAMPVHPISAMNPGHSAALAPEHGIAMPQAGPTGQMKRSVERHGPSGYPPDQHQSMPEGNFHLSRRLDRDSPSLAAHATGTHRDVQLSHSKKVQPLPLGAEMPTWPVSGDLLKARSGLPGVTISSEGFDNTPSEFNSEAQKKTEAPQQLIPLSGDSTPFKRPQEPAETRAVVAARSAASHTKHPSPGQHAGQQRDEAGAKDVVAAASEPSKCTQAIVTGTTAIDHLRDGIKDKEDPEHTLVLRSSLTEPEAALAFRVRPEMPVAIEVGQQHKDTDVFIRSDPKQPGDVADSARKQSSLQDSSSEQTVQSIAPAEKAQRPLKTEDANRQLQQEFSSIEGQVGMMEARSTGLTNHAAVPQAAERRRENAAGFQPARTAEVKIGQVDVFIEKSPRAVSSSRQGTRPGLSLASRHYLRRL